MRPKVLVSLPDDRQEYQALQGVEGRTAAERHGLDVDIAYCQSQPSRQLKQISEAIQASPAERPVAIIIHLISIGALEALAYLAVKAGIGWVVLDEATYLEGLRRNFPERLVALVTTDNHAMGALQARIARALLPRGGAVVCVEGPSVSPVTIHRRDGMAQALGDRIKVVKTLGGDWTEAGGESAISTWLQLNRRVERPDLVVAQNDLMAAGARKALRALRPDWGDVLITGCDGLPGGGQRQVREGALAATVIQPTTVPASIELVARSLRGEKVPPTTVLQPSAYPRLEELERRGG
jgi:ABC-type sugar transport system substrate-binding protein